MDRMIFAAILALLFIMIFLLIKPPFIGAIRRLSRIGLNAALPPLHGSPAEAFSLHFLCVNPHAQALH